MPAVVWNPLDEKVSVRMKGSWFEFKPDQKKIMDDHMGMFITEHRKEDGLIVLPADFYNNETEMFNAEYANSVEGKAILAKFREQAINNVVNHHRYIIKNLQVSLKRDLSTAGEAHVNPLIYASDGEIRSMEIVAKYNKLKQDATQKKVDKAEDLLKKID